MDEDETERNNLEFQMKTLIKFFYLYQVTHTIQQQLVSDMKRQNVCDVMSTTQDRADPVRLRQVYHSERTIAHSVNAFSHQAFRLRA